jgi:hypothetical protein
MCGVGEGYAAEGGGGVNEKRRRTCGGGRSGHGNLVDSLDWLNRSYFVIGVLNTQHRGVVAKGFRQGVRP